MGRWIDGSIKWVSAALTANFAGNQIDIEGLKQGNLVFYVDYIKGSEASAELQLYFDNSNRDQLGSSEWYAMGVDGWWPVELPVPASTSLTHISINNLPYRMTGSGKYRIFVMGKLPRECYVRAAVRGIGTVTSAGTVGLRWCSDEISWGGVGQGVE